MKSGAQQSLPIGIFDSGLGGLTVLKELRRHLPHEHFVYLGDTARTPYGSKGKETIQRYSRECAQFLLSKEIKLLVVACNTSSSLALDVLCNELPCPVIGTIEPAVSEALTVPNASKIGVIGTKATIASGAYEAMLHRRSSRLSVVAKACPLFVPLVEEGICSGPVTKAVIELYLETFRIDPVDALILGCTHYPLLGSQIGEFLGSSTRIVECSKAVAAAVANELSSRGLCTPGEPSAGGTEQYFVTDDVGRFNSLAALFLESGKVAAAKVDAL